LGVRLALLPAVDALIARAPDPRVTRDGAGALGRDQELGPGAEGGALPGERWVRFGGGGS
jgi:hypothetical protein